jgi:hypothetical protein
MRGPRELLNSWDFKWRKRRYLKLSCFFFPSLFCKTDELIDYLFYVPHKNFLLIWRHRHCVWRAAKFRPMLDAQGLWAGRDLNRATPAVTRALAFLGLIWSEVKYSWAGRKTVNNQSINLTTHKGVWKIYSNLYSHRSQFSRLLRQTRP